MSRLHAWGAPFAPAPTWHPANHLLSLRLFLLRPIGLRLFIRRHAAAT